MLQLETKDIPEYLKNSIFYRENFEKASTTCIPNKRYFYNEKSITNMDNLMNVLEACRYFMSDDLPYKMIFEFIKTQKIDNIDELTKKFRDLPQINDLQKIFEMSNKKMYGEIINHLIKKDRIDDVLSAIECGFKINKHSIKIAVSHESNKCLKYIINNKLFILQNISQIIMIDYLHTCAILNNFDGFIILYNGLLRENINIVDRINKTYEYLGHSMYGNAFRHKNIKFIRFLFDNNFALDPVDGSALCTISRNFSIELHKILTEYNINIQKTYSCYCKYTIIKNDIELVKHLVNNNFNMENCANIALECGNLEILKYLNEKNHYPDVTFLDMWTEERIFSHIRLNTECLEYARINGMMYTTSQIVKMLELKQTEFVRHLFQFLPQLPKIFILDNILGKRICTQLFDFFREKYSFNDPIYLNYVISSSFNPYTVKHIKTCNATKFEYMCENNRLKQLFLIFKKLYNEMKHTIVKSADYVVNALGKNIYLPYLQFLLDEGFSCDDPFIFQICLSNKNLDKFKILTEHVMRHNLPLWNETIYSHPDFHKTSKKIIKYICDIEKYNHAPYIHVIQYYRQNSVNSHYGHFYKTNYILSCLIKAGVKYNKKEVCALLRDVSMYEKHIQTYHTRLLQLFTDKN